MTRNELLDQLNRLPRQIFQKLLFQLDEVRSLLPEGGSQTEQAMELLNIYNDEPSRRQIECHIRRVRGEIAGQDVELIQALGLLNFRVQWRQFGSYLGKRQRLGAFMIHGPEDYLGGHVWLFRRLSAKLFPDGRAAHFRHDCRGSCGLPEVAAIYRTLSGRLGLSGIPPYFPERIAAQLHHLSLTKDVMLVVDNCHLLSDLALEALLDLWRQTVQLRSQPAGGARLVLFLINKGELQPICAQRCQSSVVPPWEPSMPLIFDAIKPFVRLDFENWRDLLTSVLSDLPPWLFDDLAICRLLEECGGIPQYLFEGICQLWLADREQDLHYAQYTDEAYRQWLTP
ncbi:hypothetical protein [Haliangium sp. UPWRP_2]|uniref:hypothetical protein n=1 Tax=Haliangium sp. UPWRP_2 TaxID=1931276 RepID=UPI000B544DC1|nr:hypothetical protein [Haliangium sp. UPWRP_2]PSM31871.1 hypothetical protein BVG81_003160 [Haliangium sp. UPWRP_2]